MLKLDNKTIADLENKGVKNIKVFFYNAGCSGTKLNVEENCELTDELVQLEWEYCFEVYVEKKDADKFENVRVTRTITADHTGVEKVRYIFSSDDVQQRCGCGSSFSFEEKKLKLDLSKLAELKKKYKK